MSINCDCRVSVPGVQVSAVSMRWRVFAVAKLSNLHGVWV